MNDTETTLHIISLGTAYLHAPYISDTLIQCIEEQKKLGKKTLIFYNRRGNARAYICKDCGYYDRCPHCDIALAFHTENGHKLICHQCSTKMEVPISCKSCNGHQFIHVGVGIQRIENDLVRLLPPSYSVVRIDSDRDGTAREICESLDAVDVILATSRAISLTHRDIGIVFFLLFEINLSIPEYDIEESTYTEITYFKRQKLPIYIQTYTPDHPLLDEILSGNHRSYINYIQRERRTFLYPPFTDLATLRVHDENKDKVSHLVNHLINKIKIVKQDSTQIVYDTDIWEKSRGEWTQKIVMRDTNLSYLIHYLEVEIVRNRAVTLEWS